MKKTLILVIFITTYTFAQAPSIQWQKCLGGNSGDSASSIKQTTDGGYILTGSTSSNDGDVSGNHGGFQDVLVLKLTSLGAIQWQKCLGGVDNDYGYSIQQTADGGYILTGETSSNDGDVLGNHGGGDAWIVKLSSLGEIQWQKCLGGTWDDYLYSIQQTTDDGYILAGLTNSNDGDVLGNHGGGDAWIVKLSSLGEIQWQKCFGGTGGDIAYSIKQTSDDGYILIESIQDIPSIHLGPDAWVIKLTNTGDVSWEKICFDPFSGINYSDYGRSIQQTIDGGYIVSGSQVFPGGSVNWLLKLSYTGITEWYNNSGVASNFDCQQTSDGGYILIGESYPTNGDVDVEVAKFSDTGDFQWYKKLGGPNQEVGRSIQQTADGGYILTGETSSNNGDVSGNHGGVDTWVVKLSNTLDLIEQTPINLISLYPNPVTNVINLKVDNNLENFPYIISNVEGKIINRGKINDINTSINVEPLSKGVYFIKIADNKAIKFIKE